MRSFLLIMSATFWGSMYFMTSPMKTRDSFIESAIALASRLAMTCTMNPAFSLMASATARGSMPSMTPAISSLLLPILPPSLPKLLMKDTSQPPSDSAITGRDSYPDIGGR